MNICVDVHSTLLELFLYTRKLVFYLSMYVATQVSLRGAITLTECGVAASWDVLQPFI